MAFTFAFFRNPFTHLASCYCNKIFAPKVIHANVEGVYQQLGIVKHNDRYGVVLTVLRAPLVSRLPTTVTILMYTFTQLLTSRERYVHSVKVVC